MKGGYVFDIQGFSVHDGPGCRTLVFLKGCTMNCKWCCNPEGISPKPEPLYNSEKCINDKLCMTACKKKAITSVLRAPCTVLSINIDREICNACDEYSCADVCNTGAIKIAGYYITTADLIKRLQKDRDYWGENGGVTLTGGEPLYQSDFAIEILKKCYDKFIHTAIETCGNIQWKYYSEAINYTDWIFYDLKHTDNIKHKEWTGVNNTLILKNAERLAKHFKGRLIIRMPVIPRFNSSDEDIENIADYMNSVGLKEINILPLHHLGMDKYKLIGNKYQVSGIKTPTMKLMTKIKKLFETKGLVCYEGYKTPF